jgi:hypothetical protein
MKNINNIVRELNGYRVIYKPMHNKAMKSKNWNGFVYEHIYVAEKYSGRKISSNEVVHHLDGDRFNNRSENLLIIDKGQHVKLHNWLSSGASGIERLRKNGEDSLKAKFKYPQFCVNCGLTLQGKQTKYCSESCVNVGSRKVERPNIDMLKKDLNSMSLLSIGKKYGVSDNTIRKWMKRYNLNKPTMSRASGTLEEGAETSGEVKSS